MRLITHLRHVDLAVPDYDKQRDFYTGVWGLTEVASDTGISFLAAEGSPEQYIVRLRKAEEKRLDLVSFGAATPADVDALAERLRAAEVRLISEPGKLDTPAAATASASSTSTAAPSRSPPTSPCAGTASWSPRSRSRCACRTSC
ncbi:VOC family protein [Thermocatellispora tengchongensis]|uniref:VOC family protein n=1 Tax=Thermocatellispora tengchongensis TaxID=1073253 RepID=UPI003626D23A